MRTRTASLGVSLTLHLSSLSLTFPSSCCVSLSLFFFIIHPLIPLFPNIHLVLWAWTVFPPSCSLSRQFYKIMKKQRLTSSSAQQGLVGWNDKKKTEECSGMSSKWLCNSSSPIMMQFQWCKFSVKGWFDYKPNSHLWYSTYLKCNFVYFSTGAIRLNVANNTRGQ